MQSTGDVYLWLKERFTHKEIMDMTMLQVNLYIQRMNEPVYKRDLDNAIKKANNG